MAHNEVLEAADLADGYILACQAVSLTPEVQHYLLTHVVNCAEGRIRAKHGAAITKGGRPCH